VLSKLNLFAERIHLEILKIIEIKLVTGKLKQKERKYTANY